MNLHELGLHELGLHELDLDEQHAIENHDAIMAALQADVAPVQHLSVQPRLTRGFPQIIHKRHDSARIISGLVKTAEDYDNGDAPIDNDLMDAIAAAMAENSMQLRSEIQDAINDAVGPLRERIATLEGQLSMLTGLFSERTIEASEVVRKLHVTNRQGR